MSKVRVLFLSLLFVPILAGCPSYEDRMQDVAKNWCITIRASQVIPAYPLEEGMRPGDVYLVGASHEEQLKQWDEKGYLPMDTHLHRIFGLKEWYDLHYASDYLQGFESSADGSVTVAAMSDDENSSPPGNGEAEFALKECKGESDAYDRLLCIIDKQSSIKSTSEAKWPMAVFPSYTVEVGAGGSLGGGISLKGIPLGLSLIHASKATAIVSIKDAYSVGLPVDVLYPLLQQWSNRPDARRLMDSYRDAHTRVLYVRMITKVFLAQMFDIAMIKESKTGGNVLLNRSEPTKSDNPPSQDMNDQLSALVMSNLVNMVSSQVPKGEVAITGSSSLGVSLRERLIRPVVLGYHAVDIPILDGGELGPPIATSSYVFLAKPERPVKERQLDLAKYQSEVISYLKELSPECAMKFMKLAVAGKEKNYEYVVRAFKYFDGGKPINRVVTEDLKEIREEIMYDRDANLTFEGLRAYYGELYSMEVTKAYQEGVEKQRVLASEMDAVIVRTGYKCRRIIPAKE